VEERLPRRDHGPAGRRAGRRLRRVLARRAGEGGGRGEGARRRADGGRHQSLGSGSRMGRGDMSAVDDMASECRALAGRAKAASRRLATAPGDAKDRWLARAAASVREHADEILEANARDVEAAPGYGLNAAAVDRLTLNPKRLGEIADALLDVRGLP